MKKLFKNLFSSGNEISSEEEQLKEDLKKFEILKFDGKRALNTRQLNYAVVYLREALRIQEDVEAMSDLIMAYIALEEYDAALEIHDRMMEVAPDDMAVLAIRNHILFLDDRNEEVIAHCQFLLGKDPENSSVYFQQGKARQSLDDLPGALADYTKAIALKDDFSEVYYLRAALFFTMGAWSEALADVEKVIALDEENYHAYLLRGQVHEKMKNTDVAKEDYKIAIDNNPFIHEAWLALGQLFIALGENEDAIAHFNEAIDAIGDFSKAYAERGRAKNAIGDKEGAFEDLKKSLELNPESEEAQLLEGQHSNFEDMYKGGIF